MAEITRNTETLYSFRRDNYGARVIVSATDEVRKAIELLASLPCFDRGYAVGGEYYFPNNAASILGFVIEMHPPGTLRLSDERIPVETPVEVPPQAPAVEEAA